MDRKILFRGVDVETGKWLYGGYAVIEPPPVCVKGDDETQEPAKPCIVTEKGFADWGMPRQYGMAEVIPSTIGQYTGLTDKNGTKIFEGDIVEGANFTPDGDGYGVVRYDDGAFEITGNDIYGTFHENYWGYDFEVIGNIHDNPELLGGADNG